MSEFSNTCAVVYGKLPPDTRKDQARKFNDPNSDVQFLVATNAVIVKSEMSNLKSM